MKKITFIMLFSIAFFNAIAQSGQWVWLHGSNVKCNMGNYGTQGVANAANDPMAAYESCQWTDLNGNFWLFGGMDSAGLRDADLWEYNPATNMWTWMKGPGVLSYAGSYGTKGVPSASNNPPALSLGVSTWTDLQGNLWLFGGYYGFGTYNDLWEYTISTNEWTWVNGPGISGTGGVYGTINVPSPTNIPTDRAECAANWVDSNGDLWLLGGQNTTLGGVMNDLWRYDIASNEWTWMKGSSQQDKAGVYGTKGVEATGNTPGARGTYAHWTDSNGNFWLFGGADFTNENAFNDMWRYNPATGNWTWMNGRKVVNDYGVYGSKCVVAATNDPPSRWESRACWTDVNGNFWMFGGFYNSPLNIDVTNDLWMYCVQQNEWIWESNDNTDNTAGNWGTKGVSSPGNKPDGRGGSVSWTDNAGHLYLFGGGSLNFPSPYNDLWKFTIDSTCSACAALALPHANFQSSDSSLCENDCITFTNLSANSTSWQWTFQGGMPATSTDQNPFVCYFTAGNYDVTLVAANLAGHDTLKVSRMINVLAAPPVPSIIQKGDSLFCTTDPSYVSYQWYDSTNLVPGANDTSFVATHDGNYNVSATNINGCSVAVGINVVLIGLQDYINDHNILITPNPAANQLEVSNWQLAGKSASIEIYNVLGEKMYSQQLSIINYHPEQISGSIVIDVSSLPAGFYFMHVKARQGDWTGRFIKE